MKTSKITSPALRYFGGKWKISDWILAHLPNHKVYTEPFSGAASILLRKSASPIEIYNDLNQDVVNFFQVLRDTPNQLIESLSLTPYSRVEYISCGSRTDDPIEAARRFYVRACQGRGFAGTLNGWNGWRIQGRYHEGSGVHQICRNWDDPANLYAIAARLKNVYIESMDALELMRSYDAIHTLHYLDPPYEIDTRSKWRYQIEGTNNFHYQLANTANEVMGMCILSGYRNERYDDWYKDWRRIDMTTTTQASNMKTDRSKATESIWINPAAQSVLPTLFT